MKQIFTLILVAAGLLSFNAASAQNRNGGHYGQGGYQVNQSNGQWNNNGRHQSRDYGYDNQRGRNKDYNRQDDYRRQQEYELFNW
jgi:hypothetical protein